jgi:hypothetical protein
MADETTSHQMELLRCPHQPWIDRLGRHGPLVAAAL